MIVDRRAKAWPVLLVVLGLIGSAAGLQAFRDRSYSTLAEPTDTLYLRSGPALDRLALSFDALLSDVYWIRAIQYFGRTRLSTAPDKSYADLYPLLDLTTTLDPHFNIAYRFGAIFLSEGYPDGPSEPQNAIALLEKGFAANPHRWEYLHDIGFVHYWWLKDYEQAAHWFQEASRVPGAPEWLRSLAAVTLAKGGDRENSRALWQRILETGEHEYLRGIAEHRLIQLDVLDQLEVLDGLLEKFRAETGGAAQSWKPLIARGWLPGVPVDPEGLPYVVDPETGRSALASASRYRPLPGEEDLPADAPMMPKARP